jgi:cyclophilin family peptidyl-prolyl cis-trans isomerase
MTLISFIWKPGKLREVLPWGPILWGGRVAIAVTALAIVSGCGGGEGSEAAATGGSGGTGAAAQDNGSNAAAVAKPKCEPAKQLRATSASYAVPRQVVKKDERLTAVVRTNCGSFSIALDPRRFTAAVNSFVFLARKGFYDGISFDKAGGGKYLHGGDPPGKVDGPGYAVPGRIPSGIPYRHGVVAMAEPDEDGYGKAGSQFFIVLAKPWLDLSGVYPPIGVVEDGLDVLNGISYFGPHIEGPANIGTSGPIGKLSHRVVIEGISIEKG